MATQTQKMGNIQAGQIAQWTGIAAIAAAILNAIVFFAADAAGVWEGVQIEMGPEPMPFTVGPVVISSLMFIAVGGLVLWGIAKFSGSDKPVTLWRNVAIVVLVLSLGQPIFLLDAPLVTDLVLILMHIIAGAITIYVLTTRLKARA